MRALSEHQFLVFLLQFMLLLGAARLLGAMARRFGQPSVTGEILAGVLLGPTVLGRLAPGAEAFVFPADERQGGLLELTSWIGMVFLMLRTGIATDVSRFRTLKGPAFLASVCGIAVPFAVGIAIGVLVPDDLVGGRGRPLFTVFVATAMSISAIKVISKILLDLNLTRRDVGFVILGASMLDDIIGWVILAIVVRAAHTGHFSVDTVASTLAATVGFALFAMVLLRPLAGGAIRWLERQGRLEHATTSAVIVLTLACGALTQALGIHAIFGAFVAGLIVGELPRIKEATLDSIDSMVMGVFAPVFFAYSGLKVHAVALPHWSLTLLVLGGAIIGKVVGAGVGARLGGMRAREALAVGIGLSARGSTELVVARVGMDLGVLAAPMYALIVLVPIVTSVTTPLLLRVALRGVELGGDEAKRLAEDASQRRTIIRRRGTKILVPMSGEPHAIQALRLAAPVARLPGATLVGLSVVTAARGRGRRVGSCGRSEEDVVAASEAAAREFDLADFHSSVVSAPSVDAAVTAEMARGYDLVFLGLGRRRALSHRLLRALLASGQSDIVVVRAGRTDRRFRRILLPITGAAPSRAAAELAFLYARETRARLHILHVLEPSAAPDRRAFVELRLLAAKMLEELVERGRRERVDVRCRIATSRYTGRAILDAAVDERADLVLLGATPRYVGQRAFFGPTTDLLLAHAPCAVAVYAGAVRPEALRAATPDPGVLADVESEMGATARPDANAAARPDASHEGRRTLH